MVWNGTKTLVWIMKDATLEWNRNGKFQEWNGRESSIPILYKILCIVFTEKYMQMSGSDNQYCHSSIYLTSISTQVLFVDKSSYFH